MQLYYGLCLQPYKVHCDWFVLGHYSPLKPTTYIHTYIHILYLSSKFIVRLAIQLISSRKEKNKKIKKNKSRLQTCKNKAKSHITNNLLILNVQFQPCRIELTITQPIQQGPSLRFSCEDLTLGQYCK